MVVRLSERLRRYFSNVASRRMVMMSRSRGMRAVRVVLRLHPLSSMPLLTVGVLAVEADVTLLPT